MPLAPGTRFRPYVTAEDWSSFPWQPDDEFETHTFSMASEATRFAPVNVPDDSAAMAAFQATTYGRMWVFTDARRNLTMRPSEPGIQSKRVGYADCGLPKISMHWVDEVVSFRRRDRARHCKERGRRTADPSVAEHLRVGQWLWRVPAGGHITRGDLWTIVRPYENTSMP